MSSKEDWLTNLMLIFFWQKRESGKLSKCSLKIITKTAERVRNFNVCFMQFYNGRFDLAACKWDFFLWFGLVGQCGQVHRLKYFDANNNNLSEHCLPYLMSA